MNMRFNTRLAYMSMVLAIGSCTAQQSADLQAAAVVSCNAAEIGAEAAIAISADAGASAQVQKDTLTAQKLTADSCAAIAKLQTLQAAGFTPSANIPPK